MFELIWLYFTIFIISMLFTIFIVGMCYFLKKVIGQNYVSLFLFFLFYFIRWFARNLTLLSGNFFSRNRLISNPNIQCNTKDIFLHITTAKSSPPPPKTEVLSKIPKPSRRSFGGGGFENNSPRTGDFFLLSICFSYKLLLVSVICAAPHRQK